MYFFYRSFLDKIWPRSCITCPSELESPEEWLCSTCLDRMWEAQIHKNAPLPSCDSAEAWLDFDAVQGCMHQMKFGARPELGKYLGRLYALTHERPAVDALIPLPLSIRRQRQRGYNQCTWICHGLAEVWGLPVWTEVLTKAHRPPQAQQNKAQRAVAMEGAFTVGSHSRGTAEFNFGTTRGRRGQPSMPLDGPCATTAPLRSARPGHRLRIKNPPP